METNPNLMACPACGNTCSRQAQSCPSCGQPFVEAPKPPVRHGVFYYVVMVLLSLFIIGVILAAIIPAGLIGTAVVLNANQKAEHAEKTKQEEAAKAQDNADTEARIARERADLEKIREMERQSAIESAAAAKRQIEEAAMKFIRDKAVSGNGLYQYRLGKKYAEGDGVEKDLYQARVWLGNACTNHIEEAAQLIQALAKN